MTKASARNIFIGGTTVVLVIFLIMTYMSHNYFPESSHPENITSKVALGKEVWEEHACINCHTLLGEGAYYAPELGNVIKRKGEDEVRQILEITAQSGWGTTRRMPQFDLSEEDIDALVEFFIWMGEIDTQNWPPNIEG